jgi:hypothetical protein
VIYQHRVTWTQCRVSTLNKYSGCKDVLKYWSVFASCAFKLWHLPVMLVLSFISSQDLMVSSFAVTSKVLCLPVLNHGGWKLRHFRQSYHISVYDHTPIMKTYPVTSIDNTAWEIVALEAQVESGGVQHHCSCHHTLLGLFMWLCCASLYWYCSFGSLCLALPSW